MLKNKKILLYSVLAVVVIIVLVTGVLVYVNRNKNTEMANKVPEVEKINDTTNENDIEQTKQVEEKTDIPQVEQEVKQEENNQSSKTNPVVNNNIKQEASSPKKEDNTVNNKQEPVEPPKQEIVPIPPVPEPPKQEEVKPVKKEEFKPNMQMSNQMVEIIKSNPSQFMIDYGYNVVIDKSIIELTNQFTFTKQRVIDKISQKAGTIRVYAQDYYVDGKLVWTECYLI